VLRDFGDLLPLRLGDILEEVKRRPRGTPGRQAALDALACLAVGRELGVKNAKRALWLIRKAQSQNNRAKALLSA
jgi:hypothetical protein